MAVVKVYDQTKAPVGELTLAPEVFEVEVRPEILHLVVRAQMAAKRAGTHATKTRSFVSGGGKKPWRQKGTGRARCGSNRSPVWRHGAVVHGPQPRKYDFKINKKVRALAMRMALSARLKDEALLVLNTIDLPEIKTKLFSQIMGTLDLKKCLIVLGKEDNNLALSARNIPGVTVVTQERLNVRDILVHPQLVLLQDAVPLVESRFLGEGQGE
ncbi:MAG: 50S ribosomal protein L4 [Desulfovibrio sp.]|nr:50S ribosomal protein L4 [Desulfovibrio sp.]